MKNLKIKLVYLVPVLYFIVYTIWWIWLGKYHSGDEHLHQNFSGSYGFITLFGVAVGLIVSKKWGGFKSLIGRALLFFALGLAFQEFGQLVYYYYANYKSDAVPYPSVGDIGYFGSIPLYIYGAFQLAKASGGSFSMRSLQGKFQAIIVPLALLVVSYAFFLKDYEFDWSHPLTVFLDFGYPFGQAIYISIALLALLFSRKLLGGLMRPKIIMVLIALVAQYIADFTFLYQNHAGTWTTGGVNDYMYLISYLLMTVALIGFLATPSTSGEVSHE